MQFLKNVWTKTFEWEAGKTKYFFCRIQKKPQNHPGGFDWVRFT